MLTYRVVTPTATEISVYEYDSEAGTDKRLLKMETKSFSDYEDCHNCATVIADCLTKIQMWNS